ESELAESKVGEVSANNEDLAMKDNPIRQITDSKLQDKGRDVSQKLAKGTPEEKTGKEKGMKRAKEAGSTGSIPKGAISMSKNEKISGQTSMPNARVRYMKDQLIRAKVYLSLTATRNNPHFVREVRQRVKELQRSLGDATNDSELPRGANERMKVMDETLAKGKQIQDDCSVMVKKLRAILHSTEEQLRVHRKQTMFLTQLTAKTLPKGLHCLPLRLSSEYYALNYSQQQFPHQEKLEDPRLYHYALFSDNILAAAVVVNSTVSHAKDPSSHVFHIVTDRLNYAAMRMWFLANPPNKATIEVKNIEEFTWLNSSYSPVLRQLGSRSMIDYYFRTHHAAPDSNLKFRNPKYLSILNHLRFYLPEIFPKLSKVLFLDDDIVVQKDLSGLWSVDLKGNVNGAVETCKESFHRFDRYLNFSNPLISKTFDPHACGWAYGMNVFDLDEWKRQNITDVYHTWQKLNHDRQLWKLGTLPPGLITFWKRTHPLDRSWHVLGLGYEPNVSQKEIEQAAVIHYNGNMKPWLEIGMQKYRHYWTKYIDYDQVYLRECNINQ
ncbi:putative galacturonosyltransferase 4, partial [Drosera capensis]